MKVNIATREMVNERYPTIWERISEGFLTKEENDAKINM